jgi:hypothetical protein
VKASRMLFCLLVLFLLSGCTQWGTSALRPVDVWWACPDKAEPCSSDAAALTYVQMSNVLEGVKRDLEYAERNCPRKARRVRLRELYDAAADDPPRAADRTTWAPRLVAFTQAAVTAERAAAKTWGCGSAATERSPE